ncbi:hypothetical protein Q8A67_013920 [Cirrhinus molitorella]|uniref:Uncharacterized protein n=1 Tax=Cirrhinus molitorella TaxID=172907 RepID=A0AA88PU62_9TELE|nr:hypothetical protein Q8A67_013920 [Cirrhinus molitorella]
MEPEDVHFRSAEHLIGEEENEKATFERKEDGEEHRKAGRPPLSRIPTFQSSVGRKRVTIQSAESSPKTDESIHQGQKERAGFTEAGRVKMSGSGGRETGLPLPSVRLHTGLADALSQGDISGHTSTLLAPKVNQSLDQTPEITKDSDQLDMPLKRPPLRNVCETPDLVIEPEFEFETASLESVSEDEQISAQDAVVEDLSSCSSVDQLEASDDQDTLKENFEKGGLSQSHLTEENIVTGNDVKCAECVPDKDDGSILSGQDETAKIQKPLDSKKCFTETQQTQQGGKTANTTQTKHTKTKTCTPSKQKNGRSFSLFCLLPTILLLLGGFASHIWQYGLPKSVSHLMSQMELHWLEGFWMPQETCTSDCRLTLVESVPEGLSFPSGSPHLPSIAETWTKLLNKANRSVHIGAFYFTLRDSDLGLMEPSSVLGKKVFNQLKQLEPNGVKLKIAVNAPQPYIADTDELVATGAEVRGVDLQSITGGILHTKLWVVDKKHMYLGSANMDWRSLSQVKEVGVSVEDCSCLAQDASRIFDVYWDVGAQKNGSLPPFWPGRFSALSSSKYPLAVKFNGVPARVYLSSSPPPLSSYGRSDDLSSILSVIADAERFVYVSVMDYLPLSQFTEPIQFWPVIDTALREAACTRGVEVKLLVSCWSHSPGAMFVFLQSLAVLNKPPLNCNINAKVFEVPSTREQQRIPFARVNHAKYMVTDRVVYIGTSNWSENYFTQTTGVGLVVNQTGSAVGHGQQTVQSQMQEIFQRDWRSEYAQTLTDEVKARRKEDVKNGTRKKPSFMASPSAKYITDGNAEHLKREHSLIKPYQGVGTSPSSQWDFWGSTLVTSQYVRLTPDERSKQGSIWNTVPCYLKDWEMHVQFKIHGSGKKNLHGDGFAIWYTKARLHPGPVFGNQDHFVGLAIFVDTFRNDLQGMDRSFPYISAMVNNGSLPYDHGKDGRSTELGGCSVEVRNKDHDTYMAIRYSKGRLTIMVDVDDRNDWKECIDIGGVRLPTGYYFGASAATGDLSDNHDIISMKMYQLMVEHTPEEDNQDWTKIEPSVSLLKSPKDNIDDPTGNFRSTPLTGWKVFLLLLCALLGIVVCAVVGAVVFQKRQERNKRFY